MYTARGMEGRKSWQGVIEKEEIGRGYWQGMKDERYGVGKMARLGGGRGRKGVMWCGWGL